MLAVGSAEFVPKQIMSAGSVAKPGVHPVRMRFQVPGLNCLRRKKARPIPGELLGSKGPLPLCGFGRDLAKVPLGEAEWNAKARERPTLPCLASRGFLLTPGPLGVSLVPMRHPYGGAGGCVGVFGHRFSSSRPAGFRGQVVFPWGSAHIRDAAGSVPGLAQGRNHPYVIQCCGSRL
jgi:hypothetical protein